jgi:hypothetical protein
VTVGWADLFENVFRRFGIPEAVGLESPPPLAGPGRALCQRGRRVPATAAHVPPDQPKLTWCTVDHGLRLVYHSGAPLAEGKGAACAGLCRNFSEM